MYFDEEEDELTLCEKVARYYVNIKWFCKKQVRLIKHSVLWCFGKYCFHKWERSGEQEITCSRCNKTQFQIFPPQHYNCRCVLTLKDLEEMED